MTEELRNEFTEKLKLAKDICQALLSHQPCIRRKVDIEKIMVTLAIFDEVEKVFDEGDQVIEQHIKLMDFVIKKLKERMIEYGVVEL